MRKFVAGQVTYRVVQVSNDGEATAQVVAGSFAGNQVVSDFILH